MNLLCIPIYTCKTVGLWRKKIVKCWCIHILGGTVCSYSEVSLHLWPRWASWWYHYSDWGNHPVSDNSISPMFPSQQHDLILSWLIVHRLCSEFSGVMLENCILGFPRLQLVESLATPQLVLPSGRSRSLSYSSSASWPVLYPLCILLPITSRRATK